MAVKRDDAKAQVWAERIAAFEGSALSRRAWCRQEGLNPGTLDDWRSRLRAAPALVPIVVTPCGADEAASPPPPAIEVLAGNGVRLTMRGADATWLASVLRALAC